MFSSAAILRRWISRNGALRSRRFSSLYLRNSRSSRELDATRTMTTAAIRSSEPPAAAPCLMLPPAIDRSGNIAYRFHRLTNNEQFTHTNKSDELQLPVDINDVVFCGSSHGWLALYNRRNGDLFLSNPIADRHIKLPPLPRTAVGAAAAIRVILSSSLSSDDRDGCLAFATFGSPRRVAFCSPRRGGEWTLFGGEDFEDGNLVYSTKHKRLFRISQNDRYSANCVLECWNVGQHQPPSLDWAIQHKEEDFDEYQKFCHHVRYLVRAEHSGDLFLVVRHVTPEGCMGAIANKLMPSRSIDDGDVSYRAMVNKVKLFKRNYADGSCTFEIPYFANLGGVPYRSVEFDVYRIDVERRAAVYMRYSLEGLAMFVGGNHPFAIPAAGVDGVKADSVYFTDENVLAEPVRSKGWLERLFERGNYGGHDNGVFDYRNKTFSPCCDLYPMEYGKIRKILPLPIWFTPTANV